MNQKKNGSAYSFPDLYDAAFSYRNYKKESSFVLEAYGTYHSGHNEILPASILDVACGTGIHAKSFFEMGVRQIGLLDCSDSMLLRAKSRFDKKICKLEILPTSMDEFDVIDKYDLAICLLDSLGHLTTEKQLNKHFKSVAKALNCGGIYFLELAKPETFNTSTSLQWEVEYLGDILYVDWGSTSKYIDDHEKVSSQKVTFQVKSSKSNTTFRHEFENIHRSWNKSEVENSILRSNEFRVIDCLGDFKLNQKFLNSDEDWRLIYILVKE